MGPVPGFYHNLTHKHLDPKINLSELLQILCEKSAPQRAIGSVLLSYTFRALNTDP